MLTPSDSADERLCSGDDSPSSANLGYMIGGVIGYLPQRVILGQGRAQIGRVELAAIDEFAGKLSLYDIVAPLLTGTTRADTSLQQSPDRSLEARVVATIRATIVPAVDQLTLRSRYVL